MPVDDSEARAAAQAEMAADLPAAGEEVRVTVLRVFDDVETATRSTATETDAGATARELLDEAGVAVDTVERAGDPAAEILQAAEEIDADLLLLGGRKRSPLGSLLFGSVSQEVTIDAVRPVVITGGVREDEEPSHVCQSCGEEYFTSAEVEITTCRSCGGTKVEAVP
ncbi:MAG: universal stress protein [Halobacteriales archaeon]